MGQGGVNDWDKASSFDTAATPRRSTSLLDLMRISLLFFLVGVFATSSAFSADSVVIGRGIKNYFLLVPPCPQDPDSGLVAICMDAEYVWELKANRSLVGPNIEGTVRAISYQHTEAKSEYVRSVELFVLRPISDPRIQNSSHAAYYMVESSPRYADDFYCLEDPIGLGLAIQESDIIVNGNGDRCFKAGRIGSPKSRFHWNVPAFAPRLDN